MTLVGHAKTCDLFQAFVFRIGEGTGSAKLSVNELKILFQAEKSLALTEVFFFASKDASLLRRLICPVFDVLLSLYRS